MFYYREAYSSERRISCILQASLDWIIEIISKTKKSLKAFSPQDKY